jgi:hypothetical protein
MVWLRMKARRCSARRCCSASCSWYGLMRVSTIASMKLLTLAVGSYKYVRGEDMTPVGDQNRMTWKLIRHWMDEHPDLDYWNQWRQIVVPVVERAIQCEFDTLFRAGTSMSHLVFSTLDHHGLRDEPRITVDVTEHWSLRVSYSTKNLWFTQPTQCEIVTPEMAFPVFTRYLQHLWEETVPEPIPEVLRKRSNYEADPARSSR